MKLARTRNRLRSWTSSLVLLIGIVIATTTFVFDLITPLGVATAMPYALLVLLSVHSFRPPLIIFSALAATFLTILGLLLSEGSVTWPAMTNRTLTLVVIWATTLLCFAYVRSQAFLEAEQAARVRADKMASLGEMAAGIAHELATPLTTISGRLEMLEMNPPSGVSDPRLQETLHTVRDLTERMARIIRGVRSLARDASGDAFAEVPVTRLIRDVLILAEEKLKPYQIEVRVGDLDKRLCVPGREAQLSQVLLNLLNNAADAIRELPERWIRIELRERGDIVDIAVTDSGSGISPEIRDKVMRPFFTTKESGRGTGLGLSISQAIAESHGGSLSVDSSSSHTRFVLSLPK